MRAVMPGAVAIVIAWVIMLLLIVRSVVKVPVDSTYVVTTLGRRRRVLEPGLHLVVPIVSSIAARISMLEQVLDVPPAACAMSDGTPATVRGTVRFRVTDPALAVSEVANFRTALVKLAASEWTRAVSASTAAGALEALGASEATIRTAAAAWGIEILDASPLLMLADDATSL